ncbi:midasin [Magnaporthiopsis poae ATCC 64411]|uniref:Midasin n=1 Tax=Magnaporthiopsis poae (strain ATCC 64411 / 73-15) TaxID=644358 RepID=A0A0C4E654_MAGP6|nr:midasin [Magnaporthiopsis poae ATCC 64411]
MAQIDASPQIQSLLGDATTFGLLPSELQNIGWWESSTNALDAIAEAALRQPQLTDKLFAHFEPVFADVAARWLRGGVAHHVLRPELVISAFARVLPFCPYLSVFLEDYLQGTTVALKHVDGGGLQLVLQCQRRNGGASDSSALSDLVSFLLSVWRLMSFDKRAYSCLVPLRLESLFKHQDRVVRYLAIRIYCQLFSASDFTLETLMREHVGEDQPLEAKFDGQDADYMFLSLLEHARAKRLHRHLDLAASEQALQHEAPSPFPPQILTSSVVSWGKVLIPRLAAAADVATPNKRPSLISTPTTISNLQELAMRLRKPGPILLHGLSGSGKTSLIQEAATELGMDQKIVALHLNEQTDAKMLIGLYTAGSKPGSFQWRPGILTTAVQEGRWVLIEDLDRAPTEVMSTLLPLIERGELPVSSRGETVSAPSSFRIFATVRTSLGMDGQENLPFFLGHRFWQRLSVKQLPQQELLQVVNGRFPLLNRLAPSILSVFNGLTHLLRNPSAMSISRSALERPINARDLFRWCRRLEHILTSAGSRSGDEPISDTTVDHMFMEAVDCFLGSFKDQSARELLARAIGHEMHMSPERVSHILQAYSPAFDDGNSQLVAGRAVLIKPRRPNRLVKPKRPFASTGHARRLLEQIAVATKFREPILLVGETGIGKTTVAQQLADCLGHKLVAVNLSQQSEVGDLLGGFKPVNPRSLALPLKEEFEDLFAATGISAERNQKYLGQISKSLAKGKWTDVSKLWRQAPQMFDDIIKALQEKQRQRDLGAAEGQPAKRRKTGTSKLDSLLELKPRWGKFSENLAQFEMQMSGGSGAFAFAFSEGNIVKALRNGDWVLLDEINLASADTLESIADLLQSDSTEAPSILLSETGEIERIQAHPDFRIFAAMNPATDVGKRDLPPGLRSRFTEFYVGSPDRDLKDLIVIIKTYLKGNNSTIDKAADRVASLYMEIKKLAEEKALVDGANEVPHFSLRTLTRVLTYVDDVAPVYGLYRSLFEGFCMGFLTHLDRKSENLVLPLITERLSGGAPKPPKRPDDGRQYVKFVSMEKDRQYWLLQGAEEPKERSDYIRTRYVERNLLNLVRATSTRRFPILIQGPTSAGKTSMIEYLANYSGNKFLRINNHEHTDLQEYLGTYVSGPDGKLAFQEGILVQAMRQGSWVVLDELNLAPTDVLEALNRLLDDNRELLIPETQEVVRPHENFVLFATQNPPGLYGGRKALSRAFRNRFLELHFDDIPEDELEEILQRRCRATSPPDCRRIVAVYKELSRLRQTSRVFEQKDSFATLRDLFRWAMRDADNRDQVAQNGYMLLAERVRNEEERLAVQGVIQDVFKVQIDRRALYDRLFSEEAKKYALQDNTQGVTWTWAMRRVFVLVSQALRKNEPVVLVGETGCGKTTVCQLLAEATGKELHIVNAHQNTETGDLLGSQRPVRNRGAITDTLRGDLVHILEGLSLPADGPVEQLLEAYNSLSSGKLDLIPGDIRERIRANQTRIKALFEWADGSLVHAMKTGSFFLLDEISLADDSVLERLNSVLEPQRTLLLAEKGVDNELIEAAQGFQLFATMNPGGDFGKKELSPALRNRFTEIWVPPLADKQDVQDIVVAKLDVEFAALANPIVEFSHWFGHTFRASSATAISIREILVWVAFANQCAGRPLGFALVHGAAAVFIDTLGANPSALISVDSKSVAEQKMMCLAKLVELVGDAAAVEALYNAEPEIRITPASFSAGEFTVPACGTAHLDIQRTAFAFEARTTKLNAMRVVRALQINKPILLEGNPGVGKTTLVGAIATACGRNLTRINLSDQTDLMDLFGTDVPVEGAEAGNFAWRDAPFLQAMQKGEWVLLDEMNLASQSVLEGLNACLDHRGEVYISELDQVFKRHPDFRIFAAQNPHQQGGGRKGLPSSFVNRFILVYADVFTSEDQMAIASKRADGVSRETVGQLIGFISALDDQVVTKKLFGSHGSPWEFNLRDILRWLELLGSPASCLGPRRPEDFADMVIRQRFRTPSDKEEVTRLFRQFFGRDPVSYSRFRSTNQLFSHVGAGIVRRDITFSPLNPSDSDNTASRLGDLESLLMCVRQDLPCILVGASGAGKSHLLQRASAMAGKSLVVFHLNADVDTMDLVGGFEQADPMRDIIASLTNVYRCLRSYVLRDPMRASAPASDLLRLLGDIRDNRQAGGFDAAAVAAAIQQLAAEVSAGSELGDLLELSFKLLQQPLHLENPRFEWIDGVIVKAAEAGQWLVLDNANLCSASVLDRLNSLLERPGGFLSINEHSGPNGEPRVVVPHPEFRVFLTMDPRYGELSRAMRNRSVEIFLDDTLPPVESHTRYLGHIEASMLRYHEIISVSCVDTLDAGAQDAALVAADSLSLSDLSSLPRFYASIRQGLLGLTLPPPNLLKYMDILISYAQAQGSPGLASAMGTAIFNLYNSIPESVPLGTGEVSQRRYFVEMQPVHPLQDSTVAALLDCKTPGLPQWLATCLELYTELCLAEEAMAGQMRTVNITKPSSLNRFQRSCIAKQVAVVAKDSTASVSDFLSSIVEAIREYLRASLDDVGGWLAKREAFRLMMHYWWRTFALVSARDFEEATFQAHLLHGAELLEQLASRFEPRGQALVSTVAANFTAAFELSFKLRTGLSMEIIWKTFRPVPIPDLERFTQVVEMERLAQRFDATRWKTSASPSGLDEVTSSLANAYSLVRISTADTRDLLEAAASEISALESRTEGSEGVAPVFSRQFEGLRKMAVLHGSSDGNKRTRGVWVALCDAPTTSLMRYQSSSGSAEQLQMLDHLLCRESSVLPWTGSTSASLLLAMADVRSGTLASLRSLEIETPLLGQALATTTRELSTDPVLQLNRILWELLVATVVAHGNHTKEDLDLMYSKFACHIASDLQIQATETCISRTVEPFGSFFPRAAAVAAEGIMSEHFLPAILALAVSNTKLQPDSSYAFSAIAWVQFAIGCLRLYVPDKAFDPHLRAKVERESYEDLLQSLRRKLSALVGFDGQFGDGARSWRTALVADEVTAMGDGPPGARPIFRLSGQEHAKIQGDFNNVLNTIVNRHVTPLHFKILSDAAPEEALEGLQLLNTNVAQLISRLAGSSVAYQDLTVPLVSFLRSLQIGLSLTEHCVLGRPEGERSESALLAVTPLVGGCMWKPAVHSLPARSLEFLSIAKTYATVQGLEGLDSKARQSVFECLHFLYEEWGKKLASERKAEEIKSSLYRFRGSFEDQEEHDQAEFDDLFPDYNPTAEAPAAEGRAPGKQPRKVRDVSIQLAQIHRAIFLQQDPPEETVRALCKDAGRNAARLGTEPPGFRGRDKALLPAVILALQDELGRVNSPAAVAAYNFYKDPNLVEARKLIDLVHKIMERFRELGQVDEIGHLQPIADVVEACKRVLELGYAEPVAKMLPPVEKLHEFFYEWQFRGYASRQYTAPALYDRLTNTIVGWRRLELSTWAGLLDSEVRMCQEDADSWYFIAYQAVIAGPLALMEKGVDLRAHAPALLQELEQYFVNSSTGAFASRLRLLRQLQKHLELLASEHHALETINDAIRNFITFYSRFEPKAAEAIQRGRTPLEKTMRDVLLLASWKDTNVVALKESSRKSHLKLFRLVRKFRAVLGQPMMPIIAEQGIPSDTQFSTRPPATLHNIASATASEEVPQSCEQLEASKGKAAGAIRLSRAGQLAKKMTKLGAMPESAVAAVDLLETFLSDTDSSAAELRKDTPAFLSEENKDRVKHLKLMKAKLFSDTVKSVRQMGFSSNLGKDRLSRQSSATTILAGTRPIHDTGPHKAFAEYQFDRLIDIAPKWRQAVHDHHADVDHETTRKSAGYLEGILFVARQQRDIIGDGSRAMSHLAHSLDMIKSIAKPASSGGQEAGALLSTQGQQTTDLGRVLEWLVQVLKLALEVVGTHASLGKLDNKPVQESLQAWTTRSSSLLASIRSLPKLPVGLCPQDAVDIYNQARDLLRDIQTNMSDLSRQRPDLSFVLDQISLWTEIQEPAAAAHSWTEPPSLTTSSLYDEALTVVRKLLSAIQNASRNMATLPSSIDTASWLVEYSNGLSTSLRSLHINTVATAVDECLGALKKLDLENKSENRAATAILAAVLPIFESYSAVCHETFTRLVQLHLSVCKMGHQLGRSFLDVASHGFCMPQEKSDESSGDKGKMEGGTGLGDGEGAENISKDIGEDEDLTELAQEPNQQQDKDDMDDDEDAIDMGMDELEGDLGSVDGGDDKERVANSGDEDGDDEMDEQAGDVDDLDPAAVDEKMWNDDGEEADKDQEGDATKGKEQKEKEMGATDSTKQGPAEEQQESEEAAEAEAGEEMGPEEEQAKAQEELNRQDQNVQEAETLALPDEMDLDLGDDDEDDEAAGSDGDGLEDAADMDKPEQQQTADAESDSESVTEQDGKPNAADNAGEAEVQENDDEEEVQDDVEVSGAEDGMMDDDGDEEMAEGDDGHDEKESTDAQQKEQMQANDYMADKCTTSQPADGGGQDQADGQEQESRDDMADKSGQREQGDISETGAEKDAAVSSRGTASMRDDMQEAPQPDGEQDPSPSSAPEAAPPFKKLGDLLEKWYRNNKDISQAPKDDQGGADAQHQQQRDEEAVPDEFQHLQDEDAPADTQALGAATDEEARPVDDSMAIDDAADASTKDKPQLLPDDVEDDGDEDDKMREPSPAGESDQGSADEGEGKQSGKGERDQGRTGVSTKQGAFNKDDADAEQHDVDVAEEDGSDKEDAEVKETSTQLSTTHISGSEDATGREYRELGQCVSWWSGLQARTHAMSLSLTSQLRLILAPSQATKLSGSHRTGKRLNIKKIIPYIASCSASTTA